jgi:hypothetical protein
VPSDSCAANAGTHRAARSGKVQRTRRIGPASSGSRPTLPSSIAPWRQIRVLPQVL